MIRNKRAFTLIELIVVLIIIGILSSIAAPIMSGVKCKAIASEAVTALGSIRTAARQYRMEYGSYPLVSGWLTTLGTNFRVKFPGFTSVDDLHGAYFGKECYMASYWASAGNKRLWYCYINPLVAGGPLANSAAGESQTRQLLDAGATYGMIVMDENGFIMQHNAKKTGFQPFSENPS